MENASEALIMAGSALIFIIALTIGISSFSKLREGIDEITGYTEVVDWTANSDVYLNYMSAAQENAVRIVGAETVTSSIYRSIKENYTVYLKLKGVNKSQLIDCGLVVENNEDYGVDNTYTLLKFKVGSNQSVNEIFSNKNKDNLTKTSLYTLLKYKNFKEYIGIYQNNAEGVASENKLTYRIITYEDNS